MQRNISMRGQRKLNRNDCMHLVNTVVWWLVSWQVAEVWESVASRLREDAVDSGMTDVYPWGFSPGMTVCCSRALPRQGASRLESLQLIFRPLQVICWSLTLSHRKHLNWQQSEILDQERKERKTTVQEQNEARRLTGRFRLRPWRGIRLWRLAVHFSLQFSFGKLHAFFLGREHHFAELWTHVSLPIFRTNSSPRRFHEIPSAANYRRTCCKITNLFVIQFSVTVFIHFINYGLNFLSAHLFASLRKKGLTLLQRI